MGRSTLTQTEIAARRDRVAALYLQGKSQTAIATLEGVTQPTISLDLKAIRQQWLASAVRNFDERQAEELARLDRLESEAWAAWERSTHPAVTTTSETSTDELHPREPTDPPAEPKLAPVLPVRKKDVRRVEGRDGNPAFLNVVEKCIAKRCDILGLIKLNPPPPPAQETKAPPTPAQIKAALAYDAALASAESSDAHRIGAPSLSALPVGGAPSGDSTTPDAAPPG